MRSLLIALALLLTPVAAVAQTVGDEPPVFVAQVYDRLANDGDYDAPDALYTPRLLALWQDMRRDSGDGIGRLDFDYWTNAQDWRLSDISIGSAYVDGRDDRMIVTANFKNADRPERIRFYFEKVGGQWRLDDVASELGDPWTLSTLLRYGWPGGDQD